jgi:hypothetical protein
VEKKIMKASIAPMTSCVVIVVSRKWFSPKTVISSKQRKRYRKQSEKNIMYPEALRFVSAATDSPKRKSYASVAKRVFGSVEIVHLV